MTVRHHTFRHSTLGRLSGVVLKDLGRKIAVAVYLADYGSHFLFHVDKSDGDSMEAHVR